MKHELAIAVLAGTLGLAGCATAPDQPKSPTASKDQGEVITGSRIPRKSGPEQPVKSVTGEEWRRDSGTVIGNQPRGN